ncbi:hypothetical protein ABT390_13020 [Streptomyces aurantiacus]|uniref:Uncharacterized protein n=1 Tax=Streptomyces aurantiacus JA 4570 TaxID=1286094 RepID=S3ZSB1_9ACTN|nr:hypothetical protein [Streptomyces aurantiacus]EPH46316.1 hypothetical protein STRAU_0566 [Streptomyces aurantiacus JA 4570]
MPTTATASSPPPAGTAKHGCLVGAVILGLLVTGGAVFAFQTWQSMAGGPVRSADDYRSRVRATKEAGMLAIRQLKPAPRLAGTLPGATLEGTADKEESSTSCVDDIGYDSGDVIRQQPVYSWDLEFKDRNAYGRAVQSLRRAWTARGLTVKSLPAREKGEPGGGPSGIRTTDEDGIDLVFGPDYYSGRLVVRADGGCVRHHG